MASSNTRAKGHQSRKMFNNFLESLDISNQGASAGSHHHGSGSHSIQPGGPYQKKGGNGSNGTAGSNNPKSQMRMLNNSVNHHGHGSHSIGLSGHGGKRGKQLVSSSLNMGHGGAGLSQIIGQ